MFIDAQVSKRPRDSNLPDSQSRTTKKLKQTPQKVSLRCGDGALQRLEQERQLLLETLERYEERTKKEMGRIRDAWKEKLELEKLRSSELQKKICQMELANAEAEEERETVAEAKKLLTRDVNELSRLQKESADLKEKISDLKNTLSKTQQENEAWRASARDFCGEEDVEKSIDPATLQLSLFQSRNERHEALKDKEILTSRNRELTKKVKELSTRLRICERDHKHVSFEVKNLETELDKAKLEASKLNSQIQVLRRCLQHNQSNVNDNDAMKSPATEPPAVDKEALITKLNHQLDDRMSEIAQLRKEVEQSEKVRGQLLEKEMTIKDLERKIAILTDSRDLLLTQQQQLHTKLAIATKAAQQLPEEVDLDLRQANARLTKERDGAIRRLDSLRLEAKSKRDLLLLLLEKALGWKIEVAEGLGKAKVGILVASIYSPVEDPGSMKFTTSIAELLPFIKNREVRTLLQTSLESPKEVDQATPPGTPIVSTKTATEPRIEMAFIGRYRDRWTKDKRWKEQLSARKPFPTFAAFVCLDEHTLRQRRQGWKQPPINSPAGRLLQNGDDEG